MELLHTTLTIIAIIFSWECIRLIFGSLHDGWEIHGTSKSWLFGIRYWAYDFYDGVWRDRHGDMYFFCRWQFAVDDKEQLEEEYNRIMMYNKLI